MEETTLKKKVLIVDDEPEVREMLLTVLEGDFQVSEAGNGREALEKAQSWQPDVVLLDVMMPEIGGYEVCEKLKKELTPSPLVFMVTALGREEDIGRGLQARADGYFVKPFKPTILLQKIERALRESRGHSLAVFPPVRDVASQEDISLEQARVFARELQKLYQAERNIRQEMEQKVQELSSLNRFFEEQLELLRQLDSAYETLARGVIKLDSEALPQLKESKD